MTKYLFVPPPAYGHVNPTLAIAQELVRRGEQVVYYLTEEFRATIESLGAGFHPYESLLGKLPHPSGRSGDSGASGNLNFMLRRMLLMKVKESRYVLPQVLEAIRAELPDVILYDSLALWAQLVSQILHVPAILCCPTYVKNVYPMFTSPQKVPADTPPSEGLEDIQADLTDLCTSYHLPPLAIRDTILHPEALNIVFMPRAFHPAGETIEESYLFVGPSIAPRQDASPFLVDQMAGQPILYISLGTAFNNRPDFFNLCFQAFADQPWHVIMAHGKKIDLAALDTIPQNFQLAPYVPQLEVLQQASVFVTHAGMNSTMESLYYGVPMVLVPQMFEQAVTARRCDELGLGIALDPDTLTAETLRTAVEQVHHTPSFHENVQAMQQTVRAAGGYQRAADAIINFVRSQH